MLRVYGEAQKNHADDGPSSQHHVFRYTVLSRAIGATVSAGALHAQGWGFESLIAHHRHRRPPPVGGEAFCHLETSVPRSGSSISTRTTTGAAPPPTSSAPRRHGRLVAPSPCRRISLATSSPSRHICLATSSPSRHTRLVAALSSRFFCTISPKLGLLTNRGIFVQITEQRRKMRTPLLGNCVASR